MPLPEIIQAEILEIDYDKKLLICYTEDYQENSIIIRYGVEPENSEFNNSVEQFWIGAKLNIIDCAIDADGYLVPSYIILEPDYLIDASAIAECFQDYLISPLHYFRNKLETIENRSYLLLGNLANYFLDELVFSKDIESISFNEVFFRSFKQSPFEYTGCEDIRSEADFRLFMKNAQQRFENIKRVVKNDFPKYGIDVNYCTLEPSFYSVKYGFQGRLDLLYTHPESTIAKIIELKSGRLPYPATDSSKIGLNHKVQTYIYRLMVDSVFGRNKFNVDASILYAVGNNPGENIRNASLSGNLEKSILNLRNLIIINEHKIITGDINSVENLFKSIFQQINDDYHLPKFYINRINKIRLVLSNSSDLEKVYFYRFIRFVSRELYHHKIGDIEYETPTGTASLWNSDFLERVDALDVLFNLTIHQIDDGGSDMTIIFRRNSVENNGIVNFREGEICIVYPRNNENDTVLNRQILKGTIVKISYDEVEVRFRYKQKNRLYFRDNPYWAIEHDTLDSSYNYMYRTLFDFISAPESMKKLLLGITPAGNNIIHPKTLNDSSLKKANTNLTSTTTNHISDNKTNIISTKNDKHYPENIISRALEAENYFLIVGPPGTGKTSIFARRLIEEYYKQPDVNLLVIAYTNRAVDELCDAINAAFGYYEGECDKYIRIGSELSCSTQHRHRLLQNVSAIAHNRNSLRHSIQECRIWVSTLASLLGKPELFSLKTFQVALIDEASQILEPQIIGLLPKFEKFIMIGDHNQLATIVLQDNHFSEITEPELNEIGITDCRDSLFERLLRRCQDMGWNNSYAQLTQQGRMHDDIAAFPANHFYSENLFSALEWQSSEWKMSYNHNNTNNPFDRHVAHSRNIFFSTEKINRSSNSNKINETEASVVAELLTSIIRIYKQNGKNINSNSIGIIAPYRNQIALIRDRLTKAEIPGANEIMIDTVERFQGSQRNIIIMSFCVNRPSQLKFLVNLNHDGSVDRKLNVAITRAREQLFLIGNASIMKQHPIYKKLIEFYGDKRVVL